MVRVHREHLVVRVGRQQLAVRLGQLQTDQQRLDAAHQEEDERGDAVHDPDLLVVHREDPRLPTGRGHGRRNTPYATVGVTVVEPRSARGSGGCSTMAISSPFARCFRAGRQVGDQLVDLVFGAGSGWACPGTCRPWDQLRRVDEHREEASRVAEPCLELELVRHSASCPRGRRHRRRRGRSRSGRRGGPGSLVREVEVRADEGAAAHQVGEVGRGAGYHLRLGLAPRSAPVGVGRGRRPGGSCAQRLLNWASPATAWLHVLGRAGGHPCWLSTQASKSSSGRARSPACACWCGTARRTPCTGPSTRRVGPPPCSTGAPGRGPRPACRSASGSRTSG